MDVLAEETVELSSSDPAKVAASLQRLISIFNQRDPASLIVSLPSIAKARAHFLSQPRSYPLFCGAAAVSALFRAWTNASF